MDSSSKRIANKCACRSSSTGQERVPADSPLRTRASFVDVDTVMRNLRIGGVPVYQYRDDEELTCYCNEAPEWTNILPNGNGAAFDVSESDYSLYRQPRINVPHTIMVLASVYPQTRKLAHACRLSMWMWTRPHATSGWEGCPSTSTATMRISHATATRRPSGQASSPTATAPRLMSRL